MVRQTSDENQNPGPGQATTRKRGRPRNRAHDTAILQAAREILAKNGADALTFEAISQATGISRVSIYRRWPNKAHLLSEIANRGSTPFPDIIETEGLAGQLRAIITLLHQRYSQKDIGAASLGVLVFWQQEPDLRHSLEGDHETQTRKFFKKLSPRAKNWDWSAPMSTAMPCLIWPSVR